MGEENVVHLHNGVLLSCLKKNSNMKFADKWRQLEKNILSEVTQSQKNKYGLYSVVSGCYQLYKTVHSPRQCVDEDENPHLGRLQKYLWLTPAK